MIKFCLLIPAYAQPADIKQTYDCILAATPSDMKSSVSAYCEGDVSVMLPYSGIDVYSVDSIDAFAEQLLPDSIVIVERENDVMIPAEDDAYNPFECDAEFAESTFEEAIAPVESDIIVPVFAGDAFAQDSISACIQALESSDAVRITDSEGSPAYLTAFHSYALDAEQLTANLRISCLNLADRMDDCIAADSAVTDLTADSPIRALTHRLYIDEYHSADKRNVWAFCAGQYSNDFRGNPKYLFLYLNRYRTDIIPYWLCENPTIIDLIRHMGFRAYQIGSVQAEQAINYTGVLVSEQVKAGIPAGLENSVYVNLWHGVGGVKAVERSMLDGRLVTEIARKYIQHNAYFRKNEMYLAPSDFIEAIAKEQLGLESHQIIRSGYPRNLYQRNYAPVATYEHNCFKRSALPADVRFAAYIPTYRNNQKGDLFAAAIPDMERLIDACRENHICLIFKMHPLLESELSFQQAKSAYADCPWVYFWDNADDFYEVLDQMDLCIFDYSSMFTDFIAAGCTHFLRYAFDFTGEDLDFPLGYDEATLGRKCTSFNALLDALSHYGSDDLRADIRRISDLYWMHASPDSMDRIVDAVLAFRPVEQNLPTLYSFDIFDTLISRRVIAPEGIFYRVQERILQSDAGFPNYLAKRYPFIRANAEKNMREYYNRSMVERNDERCEIQFDEIMKRIQTLYTLTDEQTALLAQWEIEAELDDVVPLTQTIDRVKSLLAQNETVILISDMYLPKDVIQQMLAKADPILATLPLYLSSERGYQKSAHSLFIEVYRDFAPDYRFGKWIHTGDNPRSDVKNPRSLNIETHPIHATELNAYETALAKELNSYDGYLIAASMARFREAHPSMQEQFTYSFISLLFVPYVHWAMRSCKAHGNENVYLIARDGHQLKRIADVVNEYENLGLNTKYLYASRRVWRIPSFFDHIDVGFWGQGYGNLAKVNRFSKLLKALDMDEPTFREMFPELQGLNEDTEISSQEIVHLAGIFKNSEKYLHYLLGRAEEQRVATCEYLKQEMDLTKPFSIIEYWGRGYTQENFTRLWQHICGRKEPTTFYYSRSTLPSDEDNIRMNFTSHPSSQAFIESIFACINYKTIQSYQRIDGKWQPVTEKISCNEDLFYAMERYLPEFAAAYCTLPLTDRESTGRSLIDFAISWYNEHPEWEGFTEVLSQLVDSVEMYGAKTAFGNPLSAADLSSIVAGKTRAQVSKNISISWHRSDKAIQQRYKEMFQIRDGENLTSGWQISAQNIERNRRAENELGARRRTQRQLQAIYDSLLPETVLQQKILVITAGDHFNPIEYKSLQQTLGRQRVFSVEYLTLKNNPIASEALMRKIASARLIISCAPVRQLSAIKLRPGSRLVITSETPVQLFYTGLMRKETLRNVKDLNAFNLTNDISVIQTPSAVAANRARSLYSVTAQTQILQNGNIFTDCYFDADLRCRLREEFDAVCPDAAGKKLIAYIPLHRFRNGKSKYANMLNMDLMHRHLSGEHYVALHLMGAAKTMSNVVEIDGFSSNVADCISVRELMLIADVIIADYRDTTFEAPLAGVPVYASCWDRRSINNRDSIFCPVDDMLIGVPLTDTEDLIRQLKDPELYDDSYRQRFIDTYLTACDGHSAERLFEAISKPMDENLYLPDIGMITPAERSMKRRAPVPATRRSLDGLSPVLYWQPCPEATGYEVLAGIEREGAFNTAALIKNDSCAWRISENMPADAWYIVRAHYEGGAVLGPCCKPFQVLSTQETIFESSESAPLSSAPELKWLLPSSKGNRLYWNGPDTAAGWRVRCRYSDGTDRIEDLLHVNTWEWTDRDARTDAESSYSISALYWLPDHELAESACTDFRTPDALCKPNAAALRFLRDRFVFSWTPVKKAKGYRIYRRCDVRGQFALVAEIGAKKTEYAENDLANRNLYYLIEAILPNSVRISRPIHFELPATMQRPAGLRVERSEGGHLLTWNTDLNADGWRIRICTEEDPTGKLIASVPASQPQWLHSDAPENVSYRIEAFRMINDAYQGSGYCKAVAVPALSESESLTDVTE